MNYTFTVYAVGREAKEFTSILKARTYGEVLADEGIMSECRDQNFNHVFTMGEE